MTPAPKLLDPRQNAQDRLLEARRLAANTLRFLDDADRCFATKNLAEGFLVKASDNAEMTVAAIVEVRKILRHWGYNLSEFARRLTVNFLRATFNRHRVVGVSNSKPDFQTKLKNHEQLTVQAVVFRSSNLNKVMDPRGTRYQGWRARLIRVPSLPSKTGRGSTPEGQMKHNQFLIKPGKRVKLADFDSAYTASFSSREEAAEKLEKDLGRLRKYQDILYAQNRHALLVIFQGMDAAGKDSVIKHVMSGVNPQGTQVFSFKAPSTEELDHDYTEPSGRSSKMRVTRFSWTRQIALMRWSTGL
jgi:polyphosphate kinase 2 PPK2